MKYSYIKSGKHKLFTVAMIRDLEKMVIKEEITYSRMVEILNGIASSKIEAWEQYAKEHYEWFLEHRDNLTSIEAGMSEPNKPGYFRANND